MYLVHQVDSEKENSASDDNNAMGKKKSDSAVSQLARRAARKFALPRVSVRHRRKLLRRGQPSVLDVLDSASNSEPQDSAPRYIIFKRNI